MKKGVANLSPQRQGFEPASIHVFCETILHQYKSDIKFWGIYSIKTYMLTSLKMDGFVMFRAFPQPGFIGKIVTRDGNSAVDEDFVGLFLKQVQAAALYCTANRPNR